MNRTGRFHRFTAGLLCLIMVLTMALSTMPLTAFAVDDGTYYEDIYTYKIHENEATITACHDSVEGDITIPSTLRDCPVTSIGDSAFFSCTVLESIVIPDSVTSIGDSAFCSCTVLESIVIPDSVTSIGNYVFSSCKALKSIVIPGSVTSIGDSAFHYCKGLTTVNILNGVKSIGNNAFSDCSLLKTINIPASVTSIDKSAFNETAVYISAGTMTVESQNPVNITGGSIKLLDENNSLIRENNARRLVVARLALPNNIKPMWTDVTGLYDQNGNEISYNMENMRTDGEGKLYIWLPEKATLGSISAGGRFYDCDNAPGYVNVNGRLANEYTFSARKFQIDINVYFTDETTPTDAYDFHVCTYDDFETAVTETAGGRHALFFTLPDGYSVKGLYQNSLPSGALEISGFTYNGAFGTTPPLYYFNISGDTVINVFVGQEGKNTIKPTILESTLPSGRAGMEYEYRLNTSYADGGEKPTLEIDGKLPKGISFSLYDKPIMFGSMVIGYTTDYYFRGTPLESGTFTFDVVLLRGNNEISRKNVTLEINGNVLPLTFGGALEGPFNFILGGSGQKYLFGLTTPPVDLQTYQWSVKGKLPAGLSLMNSTKASAYISGTPTEVTAEPVALTVCVLAKTVNGDVYYGETDILVSVYEPMNPFEEAETLLKKADCTVPMDTANTEEDVAAWLNDTWLPGIAGLSAALGADFAVSDLSVVLDEDFTAATAGNAANPNGTDGSVTFSVDYGGDTICGNLACTVKATAYNHTHTFADTYSHDSTHHWYECTDPECTVVSGKEEHSGTDDGNCKTAVVCECGHVITSAKAHDFSGEYKHNDDSHWHVCANDGCTVTNTPEAHSGGTATYKDRAVCSVCNQPYGATASDTTPPTGSIKVGTNTWHSFLNTITFGLFFKNTMEAEITAIDSESGVMKTEYYLSDKKLDDFGSVTWSNCDGAIVELDFDRGYVIYVKITDNAGNSVIINSDGIVIDTNAPLISGIQNGRTYCGAIEVTVIDKNTSTVMMGDTNVILSDSRFTVDSSAGKQTITATDMAGNSTTYTITVNSSGHTWSEKVRPISTTHHGYVCAVCGGEKDASPHNFINSDGSPICSVCGFEVPAPKDACVYNDPLQSAATVWLTGTGLGSGDRLITDRDPQGSAYEALTKLANSDDVFATYNIYLRSGNKSTGNPMKLTFDLKGKYSGQDFTLVHQKENGTYEYFYDTVDADGDLTFGPLYELSPFMLVKGTLLPPGKSGMDSPQTGDNSIWLWITLLLVSGSAVTVLGIIGKRRRAAK